MNGVCTVFYTEFVHKRILFEADFLMNSVFFFFFPPGHENYVVN